MMQMIESQLTHFPGGAFSFDDVQIETRHPFGLRNTRPLHGMLTSMCSVPHHQMRPNFSLLQVESGGHIPWAVYFADDRAATLQNRSFSERLASKPVSFRFGSMWRLRMPKFEHIERSVLQVDTVTPVSIAAFNRLTGTRRAYSAPSTEALRGVFTGNFSLRLGMQAKVDAAFMHARIVSCNTVPVSMPIGGKVGVIEGFSGSFDVEVDALTRWLFRCAERIGLGARTAFGFGNIRVTEVTR